MPRSATTTAAHPSAQGERPAAVIDVLRRADRRWADKRADEPAATAYLEHLATFLEPHVGDQPPAAADPGDTELRQLTEKLADAERTAAARTAERDQLAAQLAELRRQHDHEHTEAVRAIGALEQTRRERDTWESEYERVRDEKLVELTEALEQRDKATAGEARAREDLAELTRKTGSLRADYAAAADDNQKLADQLAALTAERDQLTEQVQRAAAHRCAWEWPGPDQLVEPCECGRPYPRYLEEVDEEDDEPVEPDAESWEALFCRIRDELQHLAEPAATNAADLEEVS